MIIEGGDMALDAARPGETCEEVEAIWQAALRRAGYEKTNRIRFSKDLNFPPD